MATIDRIPIIQNPVLLDRIIAHIQTGLAENLAWLDYAFGRAQRLVKIINGKRYYIPAVFAGGEEYLPVTPNSEFGCFSFFDVDDPQSYEWIPFQQGRLEAGFALIVWVDMRLVTGEQGARNTEQLKAQVLRVLNGGLRLTEGRLNVTRIYERAENIYKGYTLDEVDNQFLMQPYAGFRFEGTLQIDEPCNI